MTGPAPLTRQLGEFVARIARDGAPDAALPIVRLGFTDCIAVLLAGKDEPVSEIIRNYAIALGGVPESSICLGDARAPAQLAALVNATVAHALDWDDYAFAVHPSAILVPVAWAVAESLGASGARAAAAYVAGYEVWAHVMAREPDRLHDRGWHPTGLFGPLAAAAASAVLMGLDAQKSAAAIAIAASHAGGLMANFGTMTKPYHGGKAAEAGIVCARLAAAGMSAGPAAIEDRLGLLQVLSPAGRADVTTPFDDLGSRWRILETRLNVKKYPTVGASQRMIDSILAFRRAHAIDPAQLKRLRPLISRKFAAVMPFHNPQTALEAKFSLEFCVAGALLSGRMGLAELSDAYVRSPAVQRAMALVEPVITDEFDPTYLAAAPADYLDIEFADGRTVRTPPVRRATGHADAPLGVAEIWGKFFECAGVAGFTEARARALFDRLQAIDRVPDMRAVRP
jgi:2-methylcitrate dehydratase PrpD